MNIYSKEAIYFPIGDMGDKANWRNSTSIISGKTLLYNYIGTIPSNLYVPKIRGTAVINDWTDTSASGTTDSNRNTPFYNNPAIINVNLQKVPFRNNSMYNAFSNCQNLKHVSGINPSVTNMVYTFYNCNSLNQSIKIPSSVTTMYCTFYNCNSLNQNIQIPSSVTNMSHTFCNCHNLNQNIQIPSSVTTMYNTFVYCHNLNQNIKIPSSVTTMYGTFSYCNSLNQNIQIPSSVTNMANTFRYCTNLNQNIQIPSSVTSMSYTFYNCSNLNQNIQIPSSVTNMYLTFPYCSKLNQNIQIPSSVTSMASTFASCNNLNQNIQIPSSVTNMYYTFNNCYSLKSKINITSPKISDTTSCFCNVSGANVIFPMRFINNVNSTTRNSLVTAGYAIGTGVGNSVSNTTQNTQFYSWDGVGGDYSTYTGNGTHWVLSKWSGTMAKWFNGGTAVTNVTVPSKIFGYSTAINYPCFYANTTISNVECSGAPIAGTTMINAFRGCTNLKGVYNVNIPSGITSLAATFYNDDLLQNVTTNTKTAGIRTVNMDIPNTVTNIQSAFGFCKNVANFYLYNGFGITTIASAFNRCNTRALNVRLEAPNIATVTNAFGGYTTTYRKNIYIYFKYKNGVTTKTFNAFKPVQYMGTSGNTSMANPSYNSTSNFYIYNIGTCPV